jgi:SM-20-related protein
MEFGMAISNRYRFSYNNRFEHRMVNAAFLSRLGLFIIEDFLSHELCQQMREIARTTPTSRAMVTEGGKIVLDEEVRKAYDVDMSLAAKARIYALLLARKEELESHFNVVLTDCQQPAFLAYKMGDFFHRHPDNTHEANLPLSIKRRKISVVVFLNDNAAQDVPETFSGGELTFYGLLNDPRLGDKGIPVQSRQGLLIAFPSHVKHEVRPVTRGERFSIVSWFY